MAPIRPQNGGELGTAEPVDKRLQRLQAGKRQISEPYRRKRACHNCYKRKITCDGWISESGRSCSQCTAVGQPCLERSKVTTGANTVKCPSPRHVVHELLDRSEGDCQAGDGRNHSKDTASVSNSRSSSQEPEAQSLVGTCRDPGELHPAEAWSLVDLFHRSNAEMPHGYVPPILAPEFLSQRHERNYLTELVFATTVAFGSRFALSRNIVGQELDQELLEGTNDRSDAQNAVVASLGKARRDTVNTLRSKAFALATAEACPLFDRPTYEHWCLCLVLYKLTLFGPWDSIRVHLLVQLHKSRVLILGPAGPDLDGAARWFVLGAGNKLLLYDAQLSIILQSPPLITNHELRAHYGWNELTVALAFDRLNVAASVPGANPLEPLELQQSVFTTIVHVLRSIACDPFDPPPTLLELPKSLAALANLRRLLNLCQSCLASSGALHATADASSNAVLILSGVSALLIQAECALTHHMERLGAHYVDKTDMFDARDAIDSAQMAFVRALKVELSWLSYLKVEDLRHHDQQENVARVIALEAYPRWLETAMVAMHQFLLGEGPLTSSSFSWDDYQKLQRALRAAAAFDYTASVRYDECFGAEAVMASIQTMASVDATALQRAIAGSGISEEAQMISGTGQFIVEQTYLCS